jgi:putative peptidoglycan binding protein
MKQLYLHSARGLGAPVVWFALALGASASFAADPPPQPPEEPHQTRRLESEIEEFPAPLDKAGTTADAPETRIPEQIEPPQASPPAGTARVRNPAPLGEPRGLRDVDPGEVQRVFGRDTPIVRLDGLDPRQVTHLQRRLSEMGHYRGKVDGIAGPQTAAALRAVIADQFAWSRRLLGQGQVTDDLALQLGLSAPNLRVP